MLIIAGLLVFVALVLWLLDSLCCDADVDLSTPVRACIVLAALLIGLNAALSLG